MKKIKSKSKIKQKIKHKIKKIRKKINPTWENWKELNQNNRIELIKNLIDTDVIINFYKRTDHNLPIGKYRADRIVWDKFYGILKEDLSYNNITTWHDSNNFDNFELVFQFNPLNQWKYEKGDQNKEKVKPIPKTSKDLEFTDYGNEFITLLDIEKQFDHDELTYEYHFIVRQILEIDGNEIYIDTLSKFRPEPIK